MNILYTTKYIFFDIPRTGIIKKLRRKMNMVMYKKRYKSVTDSTYSDTIITHLGKMREF